MDPEATFKEICTNCGGECCKGAYGYGNGKVNGAVWFFPHKVNGQFILPKNADLEIRGKAFRHFVKKGIPKPCNGFKKNRCKNKPDYCENFFCMGLIDMLEAM